ncbi:MAG: DUF3046 domain-containing protein [Micrococcaceae bacterium]
MSLTLSRFTALLEEEFGTGYAHSLRQDLVLPQCDFLVADDALAKGFKPIAVWLALCEELDVPKERRFNIIPKLN